MRQCLQFILHFAEFQVDVVIAIGCSADIYLEVRIHEIIQQVLHELAKHISVFQIAVWVIGIAITFALVKQNSIHFVEGAVHVVEFSDEVLVWL